MRVARPPRCYGVSWLPVSASELILSSGSKIFSPASPIIRLPGLPSFYRTTGCPPKPDPNTPNRTGHTSPLARPGDSRTLTLSQQLRRFSVLTPWERRALITASYVLGDEGRH